MIKIGRILCPTDLSPEADEALRYALALAKAYDAQLTLLYCKQPGSNGQQISSRTVDLFGRSLSTYLDANELKELHWTGVISEGEDVGWKISKQAQIREADLIVMRSRRRPRSALLLGSTAETVCRTAPCPVLVTHSDEAEWVGFSSTEIDLHRVLIAHDFSRHADLALKYGCLLAEEYQAELHLLHVIPNHADTETELAWTDPAYGPPYASVTRKLQEKLPKEALLWCKTVNSVRCGNPYKEILSYAKEQEIDLICMGASGVGWNLDMIFGSNVDHVLRHAPCPVFVARPLMHRNRQQLRL